jgi:hypothetical protein
MAQWNPELVSPLERKDRRGLEAYISAHDTLLDEKANGLFRSSEEVTQRKIDEAYNGEL